MIDIIHSPIFAIALTLGCYLLYQQLYQWKQLFCFNPVMLSIITLIILLKVIDLDYEIYNRGGKMISFFLAPSVVALGVPLYLQLTEIRKQARAILISILTGSVVGILSAGLTAALMGASRESVASLVPKSVTTPIAMGITEKIGGIPSLTAALVIATGVLGAVTGPLVLKLFRIKSKTAFGLALGAASHGIGTARAVEEGAMEGASAGLAICLNGIATAVLTPILFTFIKLFIR